ncbi:hypothetical protein MTO96_034431 [Rhipicephalus appendiculatus]
MVEAKNDFVEGDECYRAQRTPSSQRAISGSYQNRDLYSVIINYRLGYEAAEPMIDLPIYSRLEVMEKMIQEMLQEAILSMIQEMIQKVFLEMILEVFLEVFLEVLETFLKMTLEMIREMIQLVFQE